MTPEQFSTELKLGNLIKEPAKLYYDLDDQGEKKYWSESRIVKVDTARIKNIIGPADQREAISAIHLDEKSLRFLNFKESSENLGLFLISIPEKGITISWDLKHGLLWHEGSNVEHLNVKFAHQLQNLYFDRIGEEMVLPEYLS